MLKSAIEDDSLQISSAKILPPTTDELSVAICCIAESAGINIQDLKYFAETSGSIVWEKIKAAGIDPVSITQQDLNLAKAYQHHKENVMRHRWHEENEAGCRLITISNAYSLLDPTANPDHVFFRKKCSPGSGSPPIMSSGGRTETRGDEMTRKSSAVVLVPYSSVVQLFRKLGFKNADDRNKWTKERFELKLSRIDDLCGEDMFDGDEEDLRDLYLQVSQANEEGDEVEVDMEDVVTEEPVQETKKGKKTKKETAPVKEAKETKSKKPKKEEAPAKKEGRGGVAGVKRVGVVDHIVTRLKKASKTKPVSKADLLKELTDKFGPGTEADKNPEGMKSTINTQISTKLKDRGLTVHKNEKGFWATED